MMADFHFIRPLWLLLLIAALVMPLVLRRFRSNDSGWGRIIPARLLTPLIRSSGSQGQGARPPTVPLMIAIALLAVALAGPSWREAPTPVQQQNDSLVIILDLSLSMLATDIEPDRLTVAKRKVRDILDAREGSLTALVVYSADAHVVAPLTDDSATIKGMLDVLDPVIMPATGNRADLGVSRGLNLLEQGAPGNGRLLLIADGVANRYQPRINAELAGSPYSLSTLVVGTAKGGPIPLAQQGFIRENGEIVIARADSGSMEALAQSNGGSSESLTITEDDIRALELRSEDSGDWQESERELTVNRWQDDGYWLLWLVLPLALIAWRRGAVLLVLFTLLPLVPRPAQAQPLEETWNALWQREDQRAPELISQNPEQAAKTLEDPDLRGSALYRSGDYEAAAEAFARGDASSATYNRANALARAGKLEEALKAYDQVLEQRPEHEDARFNRQLVKQLLEQEQQEQSGQEGDESGDQSDQQQGDNQQGSEGQPDSQPGNQDQSEKPQNDSSASQQQQNGQNGQQSQKEDAKSQAGEQQQDEGTSEETEAQQSGAQPPAELDTSALTQGQEQWLRRVPDDPGGLLRRKFLQQYQQRDTQTDEGDTPW